MKKNIFILTGIFWLTACAGPSPLERALRQSGENRPELERVLQHYSRSAADSLKYKAACFLIENMPGHGWYESDGLNECYKWIDSAYPGYDPVIRKVLYELPHQQSSLLQGAHKCEDIQNLSSDFLIKHIDYVFQACETRLWLEELSFEQFCEYILPYRVANEKPALLNHLCDSVHSGQVKEFMNYDWLQSHIDRLYAVVQVGNIYKGATYLPVVYAGRKINCNMLGCVSQALYHKWKLKYMLIPVVTDFVPAYVDRNGRHCWTSIIDNYYPGQFKYTDENIKKNGKIYRQTFSLQPIPEPKGDEYIPELFCTPFFKDVTDLYTTVSDLLVQPIVSVQNRYIYLCVFNDRDWKPVAYAELRNGKAIFKKVGRGVVYLPVMYTDQGMQPVDYPVIVRLDGKIQRLMPDDSNKRRLRLRRKYPLDVNFQLNTWFSTAYVVASNRADMSQCDSVGGVDNVNYYQESSVKITKHKPYKYWQVLNSRCNICVAECTLLDKEHQYIKPFAFPQIVPEMMTFLAFDGKMLTYTPYLSNMRWEMKEPVTLSEIRFQLRNDDNYVCRGHWYELFYHTGRGWCSMGACEAKNRYIEFDGVPSNALLWLRDLTAGKEERIFTYEDKVRFW